MDAADDRAHRALVKRMTTKPADPLAPLPPTPYEVTQAVTEDLLAEPAEDRGRELWDAHSNLP